MSAAGPRQMLDPICDMTVGVAEAHAQGRTVEHEGRTYIFCSDGCVTAFETDPMKWATKVDAVSTAHAPAGEAVIDGVVRRWYASCRCLSDAHPEIVARLDAERDAASAH